jgi:hypothetical protein
MSKAVESALRVSEAVHPQNEDNGMRVSIPLRLWMSVCIVRTRKVIIYAKYDAHMLFDRSSFVLFECIDVLSKPIFEFTHRSTEENRQLRRFHAVVVIVAHG